LIHFYKRFTFSRMLLMLPLGILFGLSCGTAALQRELEGSLSAGGAGAPLPVADLVQEFAEMKTDMQKLKSIMQHLEKVKTTNLLGSSSKSEEVLAASRESDFDLILQEFAEIKTDMRQQKLKIQDLEKENSGQKSEIIAIKKENSELKSEINEIKATVATFNNMNPQHKEQLVNALEVRSIEDDVLQNKADISDLRSADKNFDVRLTQAISTISSINTTIHGEMDNLSGKITSLEELSSGLQEEVDVVVANLGEIDGRLSQAEMRTAVCGYQNGMSMSSSTTLTFDRVYDEVNSGGSLGENGYFTATVPGVYLVTLKTTVHLEDGGRLEGYLRLSSGQYSAERFIYSSNHAGGSGYIYDQASASRYVKMAAGETLHILLYPGALAGGYADVYLWQSMLCVSLYSASG